VDGAQLLGASVGDDVNNDGIRDMAISQPFLPSGVIWILFMDRGGASVKSSTAISSSSALFTSWNVDNLGFSLCLGGDLNGDLIPDVAAGKSMDGREGGVFAV
jgi:hypothetical protein